MLLKTACVVIIGCAYATFAQPCEPSWSVANQGLGLSSETTVRAFAEFKTKSGVALYACGYRLTPMEQAIFRWDGELWSIPFAVRTSVAVSLMGIDSGPMRGLYMGGFGITAMGSNPTSLIRWDGIAVHAMGGPPQDAVNCMTMFDDGNGLALYVGGMFDGIGGTQANGVARWDGTSWSALGSGLGTGTADVEAMVVFDDGNGPALYVGGQFWAPTTPPTWGIAKWNGHAWSGVGTGMGSAVWSLCTHSDVNGTALYAGGGFQTAGGVPCSCIARWDGASWHPLGSGTNNRVHAMVSFDDGSGAALYVGGLFTTAGSVAARGIAKWNGDWNSVGGGVAGTCYAMFPLADLHGQSLFVGGSFSSAGAVGVQSLARWNTCPACYPNCDGTTSSAGATLNAVDFQCFLDRFTLGDTWANCDGSLGWPRLTANDFACFLNRFAAGCL